jgi:hypothetical protein
VQVGTWLPELFAQAGIGAPDGTDVAGRLEPLAARNMVAAVYTSVLSTPIARVLRTRRRAAMWRSEFARDVERFPDRPALWPLLIAAWKRKPAGLARTEPVSGSVPVSKTRSGRGLRSAPRRQIAQ